jgi:hypothetical protein
MTNPHGLVSAGAGLDGAHVALFGCTAVVVASVVFTLVEKKWRRRWRAVPLGVALVATGPYRSASVVARHFVRAPAMVRIAAASSIVFGQVFLPALVFALMVMPFDGIAIALLPGILVTVATWSCGLLLLYRAPTVTTSARSSALAALLSNFGLLTLCAVHAGYVEYDPNYGIHEASNSVPAVAFVFAIASTVQAALVLFTIRAHRRALEWQAESATRPAHA